MYGPFESGNPSPRSFDLDHSAGYWAGRIDNLPAGTYSVDAQAVGANGEILFISADNLANVVRAVSEIGIIAVGMTFVILIGGIDLSVGAVLGLAAVGSAVLMVENNWGFLPSVVLDGSLGYQVDNATPTGGVDAVVTWDIRLGAEVFVPWGALACRATGVFCD